MAKVDMSRISTGSNQTMQNGNNPNLPEEFYPACWQDDDRMDNLFAPFRDRAVNPVNFETKMKFWKNLIQEYCTTKGSPNISLAELRMAFERKGKRPHCLNTVLDELLSECLAKSKTQFMETPLTWTGWAVQKLVKAPLRWGFDKVKERVISNANNGNCDESYEFVIIEVAKVISEKLLLAFNTANECHTIISQDDLIKELTADNAFKLDGIETALHYLHCHQKLSMQKTQIDQQEVTLYKFAVTWKCNVEPITPLDTSIYTLNKMENSLTKSVEAIEVDISSTDALVRQYIRDKKKQLAKSFLRKKHVLEKNLVKTSNALTTIQTLLLQIDETKQNAKIVEAFKMGTTTLKNALSDKNITVDNVEDALADVKEILETNADIQFALSGAQFNDIINDGTSDEMLEAELMDLLEDDEHLDANAEPQSKQPKQNINEHRRNPSNGLSKPNSPTTITNVIDELLEERLNKLKLDSFKFDSNDNPNIKVYNISTPQNIGL
ncbi:charged multivesicular body protein 7 [Contarinia nasturtii]|uniref:charged multivesicular body protein 7 n=1 Tax=Contarinia nasturtii TaxID=265458 RepID=UPI0012D40972|nr:charged multivesicular body protein 7 [Contarinia nasturtii]